MLLCTEKQDQTTKREDRILPKIHSQHELVMSQQSRCLIAISENSKMKIFYKALGDNQLASKER